MTAGTRRVARTLGLVVLVGSLGFVPGRDGVDPIRALVVLAVWAPAAGWLSAGTLAGWAVPVLAYGALVVAFGTTDLDLVAAGWALAGLCWIGRGLARLEPDGSGARGARARGAACPLLVAAALSIAPGFAGAIGRPWSPALARRLLDCSPVVWVAESAGVDWMRRPGVYTTVGCDRFARPSFATSSIAGWLAALGALCALAAELQRARRGPSAASPD